MYSTRVGRNATIGALRAVASRSIITASKFRGVANPTLAKNLTVVQKFALTRSNYGTRKYSVLTEDPDATLYNYSKVKELATHPNPKTLLIDVREPSEFKEGHIPNAINIPFTSSPGALLLSAEDFSEQFGFDKPSTDKELVFYCLAGVRSTAAQDLARTFGYKHRGNYVGSYEDWVANESKQTSKQ